jgi:hypothetical protein
LPGISLRWLAIGLPGLLTACALAQPDPLDRELGRYYAAHASEEQGSCQSPANASVTERSAVEGDRVLVRYTYYEAGEDETARDSVFHHPVGCTGSGERQFTVEETKIGLEVVDMTGPRRTMEPE